MHCKEVFLEVHDENLHCSGRLGGVLFACVHCACRAEGKHRTCRAWLATGDVLPDADSGVSVLGLCLA